MISSIETGAVFRIVDEGSPTLMKIADSLKVLQGEIDKAKESFATLASSGFGTLTGRIDEVTKQVAGVGDAGARAADKMAGAFDTATVSMSASIAKLEERLGAMKVEGVVAGGGGLTGLRARGSGGGGHGPGIRGPNSVPLGGGFHFSGGGGLATAGAAAFGYSVYEESEVEDIIARAMLTGQLKVDAGMSQTEAFGRMRDAMREIASKTGFSPKEVGEAFLTTERQFGGLSFADRLQLEQTLIPYAAAEARMKETSLSESFESLVGLAHMTGTYDPKQLPELAREFGYASMITPVPLERFRGALSYSMPMLHAGLDMDPSAIMFLTAMTQTAGITNTKSGTWLRSFFENAEPRIGDSKTDLAHNEALRRMGLLDDHNRVTWQVKGPDGKTDWDKSIVEMSQDINKFTTSTDPAERLGILRQAFGERGGGEASLMNLTQFIEQFPTLQAKMKAFMGGDDILKALGDASPVQKAREAWADLQNVLLDIGKVGLPPVVGGLKLLDNALKELDALFHLDFKDPATGKSPSVHWDPGAYAAHVKAALFGGGASGSHSSAYGPGNGVGTGGGGGSDLDNIWSSFESRYGGLSGSDLGPIDNRSWWQKERDLWMFQKTSYDDGVYRPGGDMSGSPTSAQTVDILAQTVNLANAGGGGGFGGGIMPASYETGGGLSGGAGGLHSGGGYTVLGGGYGSPILRARSHFSGGGNVTYSGGSAGMDQRGLQLMNYLVGQGWTPEAASIAAGNAQQESSIRSDGAAGDGGISHGMFQWNHERYAGLLAYARSHGLDPGSLAAQEGFFAAEAEAKIPGWKHAADLSAAGLISHAYEGYGDNSTGTRIANSKHFLALWKEHAAANVSSAEAYPESDFSHRSHTVHAAAVNVSNSGGGTIHIENHVSSILDGKQIAHSVHRHTVKANKQQHGASTHSRLETLYPPDSGYQDEV